jgi:ATP-dependent DNA helicase RecQ
VLDQVFGYSTFRPGQKEIIDCLMAGRDAIAFMPTGAGKSLCYQIPSIARSGTGLIISPLVALMLDQVAALRTMGVAAECIHSGLPPADVQAVLHAFVQGKLKLLYVAPERAQSRRFQEWLREAPVSLVAIDEAHCVDRWGHDFREDYLQLKTLRPLTPKAVWFACTATADHRTADTIRLELGLEDAALFQGSNDRPNLRYEVVHGRADPDELVGWVGDVAPREAGIIYCRSRTRTEALAKQLRNRGLKSVAYHAGLENEVRRAVETRFRSEPELVVVATVAFGMGIDRSDVRFVIHADPPDSADAYVQEAGRAGRDGLPSHVRLYADGQSIAQTLRRLDAEAGPQVAVKRSRFSAFLGYMETVGCRRTALLGAFGETHPGHCGNCDNCLDPPNSWNGREAAALLLATVRATGSRFGSGHLVDVLLGRETEKVQRNGHHQLPLFGKGGAWEEGQLQAVIRHLIARGVLRSDEHGGLSRVPSVSLPDTLPIVTPRKKSRSRKRIREALRETTEKPTAPGPGDEELFESLRAHRLRVAKAENVPAFVVFNDATLREMARTRPTTREELRSVRGVGDFKLERYGEGFLKVLTQSRRLTE